MSASAHGSGLQALVAGWRAMGTAPPPESHFGEILPWLIALVALVCVGAVVIYVVRRMLGRPGGPPEGFTLQDLRRLHRSGALSDEEFERAKATVIGRATQPVPGEREPQPDDESSR